MPTIVHLCRGFQRRAFLQKQRHHGACQFLALVFPFHELAALQRHRFIRRNHFVQQGLKNLAEPFASLLSICQRCHNSSMS